MSPSLVGVANVLRVVASFPVCLVAKEVGYVFIILAATDYAFVAVHSVGVVTNGMLLYVVLEDVMGVSG